MKVTSRLPPPSEAIISTMRAMDKPEKLLRAGLRLRMGWGWVMVYWGVITQCVCCSGSTSMTFAELAEQALATPVTLYENGAYASPHNYSISEERARAFMLERYWSDVEAEVEATIRGDYGNDPERRKRLEEMRGWSHADMVQRMVNSELEWMHANKKRPH